MYYYNTTIKISNIVGKATEKNNHGKSYALKDLTEENKYFLAEAIGLKDLENGLQTDTNLQRLLYKTNFAQNDQYFLYRSSKGQFSLIDRDYNSKSSVSCVLAEVDKKHTIKEAATYGLEKIKDFFPYGALNKKDTLDKFTDKVSGRVSTALTQQWKYVSKYRQILEEEVYGVDKYGSKSQIELLLRGGLCDDLCIFARDIILDKYPVLNIEIIALYCHAILVINRARDSEAKDVLTWGEEAIVFDPWELIAYPAKDLLIKRNEPNIEFFDIGNVHRIYDFRKIPLITTHYLAGTPKISDANGLKSAKAFLK